MKRLHYLILLIVFHFSIHFVQAQNRSLSPREVQEDLQYLKTALEDAHIDPFAYTTQKAFEKKYDSLLQNIIKDSITLLEATCYYQQLTSTINNGHTEIFFPVEPYKSFVMSGGTVFPLELAFENNKTYIRKNWSDVASLEKGVQVTKINGRFITDIIEEFYPQVSAETEYFKLAKIELISFPRLYWQLYGEVEEFEVEFIENGQKKQIKVKSVKALEGYEMKRVDILKHEPKFTLQERTAYLRPGALSGEKDKFEQFIDSSFHELRKSNTTTLIIDLRNNPGGDNAFSDYIVSYIADEPFYWNSSYYLKTSELLKKYILNNYDTSLTFWKSALDHENGTIYTYSFDPIQPKEEHLRFKGQVYVLINRQSHSQSTVTAAQLKDYGLATLVGEPTGEFPSLYASVFYIHLPHSDIQVQVSKGKMIRINGVDIAEGLQPDIFIQDHLLDNEDEILLKTLEISRQN